jgi:hypothetical protein
MEDFLTIEDVAEVLNIEEYAVRNAILEKKLKTQPWLSNTLVWISDLDKFRKKAKVLNVVNRLCFWLNGVLVLVPSVLTYFSFSFGAVPQFGWTHLFVWSGGLILLFWGGLATEYYSELWQCMSKLLKGIPSYGNYKKTYVDVMQEFLTIEEVAELLNVEEYVVRNAISEGKLKDQHSFWERVVLMSDLDKFRKKAKTWYVVNSWLGGLMIVWGFNAWAFSVIIKDMFGRQPGWTFFGVWLAVIVLLWRGVEQTEYYSKLWRSTSKLLKKIPKTE